MIDLRKIGIRPHVPAPPTVSQADSTQQAPTPASQPVLAVSEPGRGVSSASDGQLPAGPTPNPPAVVDSQMEASSTSGLDIAPSGVGHSADALDSSTPVNQELVIAGPALRAEGTTPQGFKAKLDEFDALIMQASGITQVNLDAARNYVSHIMLELKQFPEYDGMVIDRDIHNIMLYVRASATFTKSNFVIAAEKKTKAAAKKKTFDFDFSSLTGFTPNAPKAIASSVMSQGLAGLGSINVDEIAAQITKGKAK